MMRHLLVLVALLRAFSGLAAVTGDSFVLSGDPLPNSCVGHCPGFEPSAFDYELRAEGGTFGLRFDADLEVTDILPGTPAQRSGAVKIGDRLVGIDDRNIDGLPKAEAFSMLTESEASLVRLRPMTRERRLPRSSHTETEIQSVACTGGGSRTFVVKVSTSREHGMTLSDGVRVSQLSVGADGKMGAAALSGLISLGDLLLEVDGHAVPTVEQAVKALDAAFALPKRLQCRGGVYCAPVEVLRTDPEFSPRTVELLFSSGSPGECTPLMPGKVGAVTGTRVGAIVDGGGLGGGPIGAAAMHGELDGLLEVFVNTPPNVGNDASDVQQQRGTPLGVYAFRYALFGSTVATFEPRRHYRTAWCGGGGGHYGAQDKRGADAVHMVPRASEGVPGAPDGGLMESVRRIVFSEPPNSCSSPSNAAQFRGQIVVVERGGCTFASKARMVQYAGGAGILVVDSSADGTPLMEMHADEEEYVNDLHLVVAMVSKATGEELRRLLRTPMDRVEPRDAGDKLCADAADVFVRFVPWEFEVAEQPLPSSREL